MDFVTILMFLLKILHYSPLFFLDVSLNSNISLVSPSRRSVAAGVHVSGGQRLSNTHDSRRHNVSSINSIIFNASIKVEAVYIHFVLAYSKIFTTDTDNTFYINVAFY